MSNPAPIRRGEAAVVGIGVRGLGLEGCKSLIQRLFRNQPAAKVQVLRRDPRLLAFAAADEAYAGAGTWDPARSAIFLGVEPDGAGLELAAQLERRFGFQAMGEACCSTELSGHRALDAAVRRIQNGELDGALAGAVAAWPEPAALPDSPAPGGLAVFLALRSVEAAQRNGDRIWAILGPGPERERRVVRLDIGDFLPDRGHGVAGLLQVAVGCAMAGHHVWYCREERRWEPFLDRADGIGFVLEGETGGGVKFGTDLWRAFQPGAPPLPFQAAPALAVYAGASLEALLRRVILDERGGAGGFRLAVVAQDEAERQAALARFPQLVQKDPAKCGWLDARLCYGNAPVRGRVACLFTPVGVGYAGMGRELLLGLPFLPMLLRRFALDLTPAAWAYGSHRERRGDPLHECAGSLFLAQAHAAFTRDILGLWPDMALGLSLGEVSALIAYGAWGTQTSEFERMRRDELFSRLASGTFDAVRAHWGLAEGAGVHWHNWNVLGPVEQVQQWVAKEDRAHLAMVFSPLHCVLAGEAEACRRVLAGCRGLSAFPTLATAIHTPAMVQVQDAWYRHFRRPIRPVPGVEFHSSYLGGAYELSADRVALALTGQTLGPVDFRPIALRAWEGGARIFIEHGPRDLLTCALRRMFPGENALFLALDAQGENAFLRAVKVAAELWTRSVTVDLARLQAVLGQAKPPEPAVDPRLDVAASLFAASLQRQGNLQAAYLACLRETQGRFLEFLGMPPEDR